MDFKKIVNKWNYIVQSFDCVIKNTKTLEVFCIYMEYLIGITNDYEEVKQYIAAVINRMKTLTKYTEVKMFYNEITGDFEYRTIKDTVFIKLDMLSKDSIKAIFGDEFFNFLIVNDYEF